LRRYFFIKNFIQVSLPVILAVSLIGSLTVYLTVNETKKSIANVNSRTVQRIQENTELIFSEADAQSLNYSVSPMVMMRLEELLLSVYATKEARQTTNIFKTIMDSNVNSKAFLHSIYIYFDNPNRNFFASMIGLANTSNMGDTEWLERMEDMPEDKMQWLELRTIVKYTGVTQYTTDVISLYKWLYTSGRTGRVGILVLNVQLGYLKNMYVNNLTYPGQAILLTDSQGKILCATGDELTQSSLQPSDLEQHFYVEKITSESLGIEYLSVIPKDVLHAQSREMVMIIVALILVVLLVCTSLAFFITRRSTKNIYGIIQLLSAAEKGEELPALPNRNDVYGYITQNIVKTYLERNQLDKQLLEKKLKLEAMHFSFLQSQLNPHFLFNTLKNIFWKTVRLTGGTNEAGKMIELLTSILHYTLVHPDRYVRLQEEMLHTQKYIQIQQMRFDYGFNDIWEIEPELYENKCIKFLLQPLIENSISHGLAGTHDGTIRIRVWTNEDRICFMISDNGTGFTAERLEEVQRAMQEEISPTEHIGLFNVNKRLILAYDEQSSLHIESISGEGCSVSFSIPLQSPAT
jgi:two-component system sensor histidine kinase YesM